MSLSRWSISSLTLLLYTDRMNQTGSKNEVYPEVEEELNGCRLSRNINRKLPREDVGHF